MIKYIPFVIAALFIKSELYANPLSAVTIQDSGVIKTTTTIEEFLDVIDTWRGTPFKSGYHNKDEGVDDGGLISELYREACGLELPADPQKIWSERYGQLISPVSEDLSPGDVLFYPGKSGTIERLAIYLGDDDDFEIVNVSRKTGVTAAHLQDMTLPCAGAKRFVQFNPGLRVRGSGYIAGVSATNATVDELINEISGWIGTPYVWGNNKKKTGTDCSGFVTAVFKTVCGLSLPRSSYGMWSETVGEKIETRNRLTVGDVLFFKYGTRVGHVAIYLGKNSKGEEEIVHAKNDKELLGKDLFKGYWVNQYVGAKRFASFKGIGIKTANKDNSNGKTIASVANQVTYRSSQENVNNVVIVNQTPNLMVTWNYKNGSQEKQIAHPVNDEAFKKKFGTRIANPVFYRYDYTWKDDAYTGTLIADEKGRVALEVDHNTDEGEMEIYNYTVIQSSTGGGITKKSGETSSGSGTTKINKSAAEDGTRQTGEASYYADKFHGRKTANGETFDMNAMTAAHHSLPFGTLIKVTNTYNNKSVQVRINDRGPFVKGRILDVSYAAAKELDMIRSGVADVILEVTEGE
jgi:rare lipoprotein A